MRTILLIYFLLGFSFIISAQDITTGLVAHYPFCGNLNDNSGNENNGVFMGNGSPTYSVDRNGEQNSSLELNGFSEYVEVASSVTLNSPVEEVTVSCWINFDSYFNGWLTPFVKTNGSEVISRQYGIGINGNTGQIYMNTTYVGQSDFSAGNWYHIAITYNDDVMKCYLNGEFLASETASDPVVQNDLPLEIGIETPVATEFYDGKIDEIRIYNRALTDAEIALLAETDDCTPSFVSNESWHGNINIYPNPFSENVNIDFYGNDRGKIIKLYDGNGRLIKSYKTNDSWFRFSTEDLIKGLYQIQIISRSSVYTDKLLKL